MSHELRTPLTSIKGYIEALLDGAKDDPATQHTIPQIILKQSDRLNLIIEDLLELSKIESGQVLFKENRCISAFIRTNAGHDQTFRGQEIAPARHSSRSIAPPGGGR